MPEVVFHELVDFTVKVNGSAIAPDRHDAIIEVVVDSNMHLPDMASIKFHDPDLALVDDAALTVGKSLAITVKRESENISLFDGEITAIEPEFNEDFNALLVVRGYDKSHRLHRGKKTRVFANKTDSDIVQQIAGEAGLTVEVDSTSTTYAHVWQNNETDMEFCRSRAELNGYKLHFQDGKLLFKKYTTSGSPVELEWGTGLIRFRSCIAATHQVDEATFRAWDPAKKEAVEGKATSASSTGYQGGVSDDGGQKAKSAFGGSAKEIVVDVGALTQSQAKDMAQARYDEIAGDFVQAEGACYGNPQVKAGVVVNITKVGTKFSGKYVVSSATHIFTTENGYQTQFSVHGRQPDTLADLVAGRIDPNGDRALVHGVVPAMVTNVQDPDGLGKVKVKFPWLEGQLESTWARIAAPGAGPKRGVYYLPEVNDEVLVAFEHGDINRPYVLGGLWNKNDEPPKKSDQIIASGKIKERIIQSLSGHVIILGDESGKEMITIRDKTGNNEIVIDSANNKLNITIADGGVNIESKGTVTVKSTNGDLAFEGGNVSVKASKGDVKIEGTNCNIAAQSSCEIKANASCTVQGTAGLTLKGAPPAQIAMTGTVSINNGALDVM